MQEDEVAIGRTLATDSAERYLAHLDRLLAGDLGEAARKALEAIVLSLKNVVRLGADLNLTPADVPFTKALLELVPTSERKVFVHQFALGVGNPVAPVIVMGTEHAYDFDHCAPGSTDERNALESLAAENCTSALFWLSEADSAMAAHVMSNSVYAAATVPFHRQPWAFPYANRVWGGHTWRVVAKALGAQLFATADGVQPNVGPRELPDRAKCGAITKCTPWKTTDRGSAVIS